MTAPGPLSRSLAGFVAVLNEFSQMLLATTLARLHTRLSTEKTAFQARAASSRALEKETIPGSAFFRVNPCPILLIAAWGYRARLAGAAAGAGRLGWKTAETRMRYMVRNTRLPAENQ